MKGQIFILGALTLALAMLMFLPSVQKELYLPDLDNSVLENIAGQYNYWLSYSSTDKTYDPMAFGRFVKENYPYVEVFYVLKDGDKVYMANFLSEPLNASINGKDFLIEPNSVDNSTAHGNITFQSDYRNFTYKPENSFSGAIFLRIKTSQAELNEFKVYR